MRSVSLLLLLVSFACAGQSNQAPDVAQLRALEDELALALVERDKTALERLWHDDLIFIARNGQQSTRAERLANLDAAPQRRGETSRNDAVAVRIENGAAIVTVLSTWTMPTDEGTVSSRYSALHVWTRSGAAWQLIAAQVASLVETQ
jgi:ketosteroid isomerase-like protein